MSSGNVEAEFTAGARKTAALRRRTHASGATGSRPEAKDAAATLRLHTGTGSARVKGRGTGRSSGYSLQKEARKHELKNKQHACAASLR